MKTFDAIADIWISPDSPALLYRRQKYGVVDGEVSPIGESTEHRLSLGAQRVQVEPGLEFVIGPGSGVTAKVKNTGFIPVAVARVSLMWRQRPSPEYRASGFPDTLYSVGVSFPALEQGGVLNPLESRVWTLPTEQLELPMSRIDPDLGVDNPRIVVIAGDKEVGSAPAGMLLDPLAGMFIRPDRVRFSPLSRDILAGLPRERRATIEAKLEALRQTPLRDWAGEPSVTKVASDSYFVHVPPDYRVLVTPKARGDRTAIFVDDIARSAEPEKVAAEPEASGRPVG